jgi:hypothetical protein
VIDKKPWESKVWQKQRTILKNQKEVKIDRIIEAHENRNQIEEDPSLRTKFLNIFKQQKRRSTPYPEYNNEKLGRRKNQEYALRHQDHSLFKNLGKLKKYREALILSVKGTAKQIKSECDLKVLRRLIFRALEKSKRRLFLFQSEQCASKKL